MKYNKAKIMESAWEIRKTGGVTMSEAMKTAWGVAKIKVGANPMDDTVQEYFKRLEAADKAMKALEEIKAVKADHADIYAAYTKAQTSRRFLCKPVAVPA